MPDLARNSEVTEDGDDSPGALMDDVLEDEGGAHVGQDDGVTREKCQESREAHDPTQRKY